jgi:hypothetical protein
MSDEGLSASRRLPESQQSRLKLGLYRGDRSRRPNALDCRRTSRRWKAFRCVCGRKADGFSGTRIGDSQQKSSTRRMKGRISLSWLSTSSVRQKEMIHPWHSGAPAQEGGSVSERLRSLPFCHIVYRQKIGNFARQFP